MIIHDSDFKACSFSIALFYRKMAEIVEFFSFVLLPMSPIVHIL